MVGEAIATELESVRGVLLSFSWNEWEPTMEMSILFDASKLPLTRYAALLVKYDSAKHRIDRVLNAGESIIYFSMNNLRQILENVNERLVDEVGDEYRELEEDQKSITQHLEENEKDFSILNQILDTTGLNHLFRTYGDYTFLAPVNSAFEEYFAEKGKSSYTDFTIEELEDLIKYHILQQSILAGSFSDGIIQNLTLTLDYMTSGTSFDGSDITFNKNAKILTQDWISANGIIHTVDKVIEKPLENIYEWLSGQENYKIFVEALEKTGLEKLHIN